MWSKYIELRQDGVLNNGRLVVALDMYPLHIKIILYFFLLIGNKEPESHHPCASIQWLIWLFKKSCILNVMSYMLNM
jgi:hypothetical protein